MNILSNENMFMLMRTIKNEIYFKKREILLQLKDFKVLSYIEYVYISLN